MRHDPAEVKRRLSDPREVARLLGCERGAVRQARGLLCPCPVHGNRSPSLSLRRGADGTLAVRCHGCGLSGDVLSLLAAVEGGFAAGLARGAELAGGAAATVSAPLTVREEAPRLPAELYAALAERVIEEGRLDGRSAVRDVARYLDGRGLLEQARGDGWAALPSMKKLLDIAREVWEGWRVAVGQANERPKANHGEPSGQVPGGFAFRGPGSVLVAAGLARWREGKLEPLWGGHRLVIPWRGPDGRIHALQRRHLRPRWLRRDGSEYPRYVAPWGLIWPYGVDHIAALLIARAARAETSEFPASVQTDCAVDAVFRRSSSLEPRAPIAIVEGAVDTLALRALYPRLLVVGLPGLGGWEPSWARLFAGRSVRLALDCGKPGPDGVVAEDRVAARIALDLAGRFCDAEQVARARFSRCVLCESDEPWLCGACGRRRAPEGQDWGEAWRAKVRGQRA